MEPEAASLLQNFLQNNEEAYDLGLVELEMEFFDSSDDWPSHCAAAAGPETQGLVSWAISIVVSRKASDAGIPAAGGEFVTHDANLVSVTGILIVDENTRRAEYEWNYEPTELGRALELTPSENEQGQAVLRLYDDGWRVVD